MKSETVSQPPSQQAPNESMFRLLTTQRFLPYFVTQALGAFNDNILKNSLLLIIAFGAFSDAQTHTYTNLAAGLFILPFFLFSPIAGQVADKFEKSKLIRVVKLIEVGLMSLAAITLQFGNMELLLVLLFLMGTQSAFFGPVKFSLLPQTLHQSELVGGNALVEIGTFLAILGGTLLAGVLFTFEQATVWVAWILVVIALCGALSSLKIPYAHASNPSLSIKVNPMESFSKVFAAGKKNHAVYQSILGTSWFWFIGAAYLTQFPVMAKLYLGGHPHMVTMLLIIFSVGVGLGSWLCERFSFKQVELGIVPLGSLGMSLFGIDLYFSMESLSISEAITPMVFLQDANHIRVVADIFLIAVTSGLFIVPLNALIQERSEENERAQVIAASNLYHAFFMVISAATGILCLSILEWSIAQYFLLLGIGNIVVAAHIYRKVPEFALRFMVYLISHTMYRVKTKGGENIPKSGPVVLTCNHVSYVDAMIIAGAVKRPIRFVMDRAISEMPGMKTFFRVAQTIPICSPKQDVEVYKSAFNQIKEALVNDEVVCIFPEGRLTSDGELGEFKSGITRIIEESPEATIIPMALKGLWGSFFSHKGGHALTTKPKRFWSRVELDVDTEFDKVDMTPLRLEQHTLSLIER